MAETKTDIAIIGGGLAGLILALSLRKHGIKSAIYESRPRSYRAGGYIALSPNALRVLQHLGVYDAVTADSYVYEGMELLTHTGSVIGTVFLGSRRVQGFPSVRIRRDKLREVLLSAAGREGIDVVYERALKGLVEANGAVELDFGDGAVVTSGLVIGADGLRSTVRRAVEPDAQPYYNGFTVVYGLAEKEDIDKESQAFPIPSMVLGPEGSFGIIPVDPAGERLGFLTGLQLPDRSMEEWGAFRKDKDGLRALLAESFCKGNWPGAIRELCEKTSDGEILSWPAFVLPELAKWTSASGHVVLIGDAAHAMSPASGQGGAMAFEDAETLAWALSRDGGVSGPSLPLWAAHRQQRLRRVVAYTAETERRRRPSPNWILQRLKELAVWALLWYHGEAGLSPWVSGYDGEEQMERVCKA